MHRVFKLVADAATDQILGVHVVAENTGAVMCAGLLAAKFNPTVRDLAETLAPYLTMAEGLKLDAENDRAMAVEFEPMKRTCNFR